LTEIMYYPVVDADSKGSVRFAMNCTPDHRMVADNHSMWLEETVPNVFRFCSKRRLKRNDATLIHCPRCSAVLKRITHTSSISKNGSEYRMGLYECSACANK